MCDMCGEIFVDENALAEHEKLNHQDETLGEGGETDEECILNADDLGAGTEDKGGNTIAPARQKSVPYVCKNSDGKFECTICHKSFQLKSTLREHYFRLHCGSKLLQCTQCVFACYSKSALDVHLVKCHTKRYTCEMCGKMFPYKYQLTTHINGVHLGIRNHTCEMCGKSFKTRANFDSHLARHRDVRNFPCPHCEHRSRTNHDLTVHLRKHTGEKPYVCEICGRAFAHSINRVKHQRSTHEEPRNEGLYELQMQGDQLLFESEQSEVEYTNNRFVNSRSQIVELDTLQFPDNELAGD